MSSLDNPVHLNMNSPHLKRRSLKEWAEFITRAQLGYNPESVILAQEYLRLIEPQQMLNEISKRLLLSIVASCTCETKSHEINAHAMDCRFRRIHTMLDAVDLIQAELDKLKL